MTRSLRFLLTRMRNQFFYRRNLPHWFPRGATIFVTWRLFGSLPESCVQQLKLLRSQLRDRPIPANTDPIDWELRNRKLVFAAFDSMLDNVSSGPTWLKLPEIATIVEQALLTKYSSMYKLWSYCFDHWIRNQQEFDRVVAYIENNPVKAGLVQTADEWEFSSASERIRRGWDCVKPLT